MQFCGLIIIRVDDPETQQRKEAERVYDGALDLLASGATEKAVAEFRRAVLIDPNFLDASHGLIRALQDSGGFDEAIDAAQTLIERDPEDALAHTSLSILYQHKGMVPEAESESLKAKLLGWKMHLKAMGEQRTDDVEGNEG